MLGRVTGGRGRRLKVQEGIMGMQGQDTGNAGGDTGDGEGILEVEVRMQG